MNMPSTRLLEFSAALIFSVSHTSENVIGFRTFCVNMQSKTIRVLFNFEVEPMITPYLFLKLEMLSELVLLIIDFYL